MKIIIKIGLTIILLSSCLRVIAAQAPAEEPIPEICWRQKGVAFMAGLHTRLGAGSIVNQLPQHVAQDIVKLAKPKEEYGFIKNFTDEPIGWLIFEDNQEPRILLSRSTSIIRRTSDKYASPLFRDGLSPYHQIRFITEGHEGKWELVQYISYRVKMTRWISDVIDRLFDIYVLVGNCFIRKVKNVHFSDLMNLKISKEGKRVRLEVTSPYHGPVSYYSELVEAH